MIFYFNVMSCNLQPPVYSPVYVWVFDERCRISYAEYFVKIWAWFSVEICYYAGV